MKMTMIFFANFKVYSLDRWLYAECKETNSEDQDEMSNITSSRKECVFENSSSFFSTQPKHMLRVLKRTVSIRWFF